MNFTRVRTTVPRDHGGIGAVIFLIVALVFAPVIGMHLAGLAEEAQAAPVVARAHG